MIMEKYVVFGPIIVFFAIFGLIIFGLLGFIIRLIFKSKNEDWTGVVIDKKHNQTRDFDDSRKINDFYFLVVKMEVGRDRKVGLSKQMWDKFEIGDKIHKPKGKLIPEKVEV